MCVSFSIPFSSGFEGISRSARQIAFLVHTSIVKDLAYRRTISYSFDSNNLLK